MLGQGILRKRKEPEGPASFRPPPASKPKPSPLKPAAPNRLLAGYLAHEFLTSGTLFGRPFPPARADLNGPGSSAEAEAEAEPSKMMEKEKTEPPAKPYADVASLLMSGGAHVPGVVNPTQLGQWLEM